MTWRTGARSGATALGLLLALAGGVADAGDKVFRVYFTANSANLTPEARQVVLDFTNDIEVASSIAINAHADPQEIDPAAIAAARAETVAAMIAEHAHDATRITATNMAGSEPEVPSEAGKSKPENRFVHVVIR
jgi:flagellar motor protein MotB